MLSFRKRGHENYYCLLPHLNYFLPYWIGALGSFLVHLLISLLLADGRPVPVINQDLFKLEINLQLNNMFCFYVHLKVYLVVIKSPSWPPWIGKDYYDTLQRLKLLNVKVVSKDLTDHGAPATATYETVWGREDYGILQQLWGSQVLGSEWVWVRWRIKNNKLWRWYLPGISCHQSLTYEHFLRIGSSYIRW